VRSGFPRLSARNPGAPKPGAPARAVVARFATLVCPPEVRTRQRTERVLAEFGLLLAALPPGARRGLIAAFTALDQGARLYPRSAGRRLTRLGDAEAEAYLRFLLGRPGALSDLTRKLTSAVVMCYYELPDVQDELGYRPQPYIEAVSQRRLARYGAEIRRAEAATVEDGTAADSTAEDSTAEDGGE